MELSAAAASNLESCCPNLPVRDGKRELGKQTDTRITYTRGLRVLRHSSTHTRTQYWSKVN